MQHNLKQKILLIALFIVLIGIFTLRSIDTAQRAIESLLSAAMNVSPIVLYTSLIFFFLAIAGFLVYALIETRTLRKETGEKIPSSVRILLIIPILAGIALLTYIILISFIATREDTRTSEQQQQTSQENILEKDLQTPNRAIEDWKVYRNEEFGFEIRYPQHFQAFTDVVEITKEGKAESEYVITSPTSNDSEVFFSEYPSHFVCCEPTYTSVEIVEDYVTDFEEWLITNKKMPSDDDYRLIKKGYESFKGENAYRVRSTVGIDSLGSSIILNHEGNTFFIYYSGDNDEVFTDIAETFRFIEPIDTSNWQTYRNDEFGFEFQYPQSWLWFQAENYVGISPCSTQQDVRDKYFVCGLLTFEKNVQSNPLTNLMDNQYSLSQGFTIIDEYSLGQFKLVKMGLKPSIAQYYLLNDVQQIKTIELTNREGLIEQKTLDQILSTFRFIEPTSTVKVAVIALDDRGKSGKKIGCDDSIVYITRTSSSTADPLNAALEELFSLDSLYIKDPALKHAWYASGDGTEYGLYNIMQKQVLGGLEFDRAIIENGIAKVYLNGAFGAMGGICDEPRLPAQIEGTAEQFPGVESVEIYMNEYLIDLHSGSGRG